MLWAQQLTIQVKSTSLYYLYFNRLENINIVKILSRDVDDPNTVKLCYNTPAYNAIPLITLFFYGPLISLLFYTYFVPNITCFFLFFRQKRYFFLVKNVFKKCIASSTFSDPPAYTCSAILVIMLRLDPWGAL